MAASLSPTAAESERSDDSAFPASDIERLQARAGQPRWPGWRRRALVLTALLGCIAVLWLARWIAASPFIDARWDAGPAGSPRLASSPHPELQAQLGRSLAAVGGRLTAPLPVDAALLHRSPRWQVSDAARDRQVAQHEGLASTLAAGRTRLQFADGSVVEIVPVPRGWAGLGGLFWPLAALAWLLLICGTAVLLARPHRLNLPYAMMALCQAGNLLYIALETAPGLGLPAGVMAHDMLVRMALDGVTGAAAVTSLALHPLRLPGAGWIGAAAWSAVAAWLALARAGALSPLWWWVQALCLALAAAALATVAISYRADPHPHAMVMRRFAAVALATLGLVTAAAALAADLPLPVTGIAAGASVAWYLFLSSLLLLIPFLARSRQMPREFMLLAGVATVATSLDLLFAAVFALEAVASLVLALAIALVLYGQARRWMLEHAAGRGVPSTERTFELLYRAARELQARPGHYPQLLKRLLRELFEPLEVAGTERVPTRTRVVGDGAALVVPVRERDDGAPAVALVLRYAQQGRRLFTQDDARLVDRVIEQMRRAVAYDQAVERGRHEERLRIAQDLHDDIGARLLTLMYQAPTPEMEDYIRHTLQDLKTLTRGLAATDHRLSHAAVEWKADLAHRLAAAQTELDWSLACDRDLRLTVVQWSALTRVLRELVSNALYHGHATRVAVHVGVEGHRLVLQVADDGRGRAPQAWSHGLGLGGVRKRVKQLGGEVQWEENVPRGIVCEVRLSGLGDTE